MCGVFGFCLNRPLVSDDMSLGRRALKMLAHRGPDGEGEWFDINNGIYLGHRRLAIIDTTVLSKQPIDIDGSILSFNGELYNFVELRNKLIDKRILFSSTGDGEVLLQAWKQWGAAALNQFDGMYAFALYDGSYIHLVTDPFGEKPLYLLRRNEGYYFASEAQVLIDLFTLEFSPEQDEIAALISLGFLPSGKTGFKGLESLPQANHLRLTKGEVVDVNTYWVPHPTYIGKGAVKKLTENQIDDIQTVLLDALSLRMRADVPVGLFLSGGIDSALVAAMIAKDLDQQVQALTVSYPDGVDESKEAAKIANYLGLPHVIVDSRNDNTDGEVSNNLKKMYGVPNDNLTALSVYQMSKLAKQYMSVALSGTGGDELFYGYNKYHFFYKNRYAYKWLSYFSNLFPVMEFLFDGIPKFQNAIKLLRGNPAQQFLSLKNNGLGRLLEKVDGFYDVAEKILSIDNRELVMRVRDFDVGATLPNSIIPSIDRGSMRAGFEVRTPFLSRELYNIVSKIDQRSFLAFGQKEVLRRILARYIPSQLTDHPKRGFVFPSEHFLSQQSLSAPDIPWLSSSVVEQIWNNKNNKNYRGLAMRIAVLSSFKNS